MLHEKQLAKQVHKRPCHTFDPCAKLRPPFPALSNTAASWAYQLSDTVAQLPALSLAAMV